MDIPCWQERMKGVAEENVSENNIPKWAEGGGKFITLNFHDKRHITSLFYCDIIKNTIYICLQSLNHTSGTHSNSRSALSGVCSNIRRFTVKLSPNIPCRKQTHGSFYH